MDSRIRKLLTNLNGRKLLIPFFTAGYPDLDTSLKLVNIAEQCGADMVELGVPFSDPLADGVEIQYSSKCALDNQISVRKILEGVKALRKRSQIPIILMGYYNPLIAYGETKFMKDAHHSGVDGLIIPDLPIEEAHPLYDKAKENNLSMIFLVSPTSSKERIELINRYSTDFVYAITVTGVTGTGKVFGRKTDVYFKKLKKLLSRPFVAGFGVASPESAKRLTKYSDGVVIGSAIIKIIRNAQNKSEALKQVEKFLSTVRKAIP
ncbi:MAG: tryptophan synthase subunit alpha [FCB group bacterium]|nr:tryptophan synthase subunit alpha [FCB group bacterium]